MKQWINPDSARFTIKTVAKFNSLVCGIAGFNAKTAHEMVDKSPDIPDREKYLSRKEWLIYILKFMEMWTNVLKKTLKDLEQHEKPQQEAVVDKELQLPAAVPGDPT